MPSPTPQQGQGADLQVDITASPNPVRVRHRLTLTIFIRNAGLTTAKGVAVRKTLPEHIILQSIKSDIGTCRVEGDEMICEIGIMPPGGTATVVVVVRPLRAGPMVESEVAAAAFAPDPESDTQELVVIVVPLGTVRRQP